MATDFAPALREIIEQLDDRFRAYHGTSFYKWDLHSFVYYGMTYGIELLFKDHVWQFRQVVDSGYNTGRVIYETTDSDRVLEDWAHFFAPTNPNFKTDRK